MKLYKISIALFLGLGTLTSCNDKLELVNPNQQTSSTFGFDANDLEESVVAAYNHIRMEGSYARVGYTIDVCRGDEAWNSSQVWYLPFDDLDAPVTSDITWWPWREWYYTINVCNFAISRCGDDDSQLSEQMRRIKGQADAQERALDANVDCGTLLQQIAAIRGAVNGLMSEVLEAHVREEFGVAARSDAQREARVAELTSLVRSYLK